MLYEEGLKNKVIVYLDMHFNVIHVCIFSQEDQERKLETSTDKDYINWLKTDLKLFYKSC